METIKRCLTQVRSACNRLLCLLRLHRWRIIEKRTMYDDDGCILSVLVMRECDCCQHRGSFWVVLSPYNTMERPE